MSGLLWLFAVLAILFTIGLLSIGIDIAYKNKKATVRVKISQFRITLYPRKPIKGNKKPKKAKKTKKRRTKKTEKITESTSDDIFSELQSRLPILIKVGKSFYRKLVVDKLLFLLTIPGAEDPAEGAMRYAQANFLLGTLWNPLTKAFHVEDGRAGVRMDFEQSELALEAQLVTSIKIYQMLWITLVVLWDICSENIKLRKQRKAV